jgi:hypothetical protein
MTQAVKYEEEVELETGQIIKREKDVEAMLSEVDLKIETYKKLLDCLG